MGDGDVKPGEEQCPMNLLSGEFTSFSEDFEALMIREDFNGVRGAFQEMSPILQSTDDGQEFMIVDIVVLLCWGKGFRHE